MRCTHYPLFSTESFQSIPRAFLDYLLEPVRLDHWYLKNKPETVAHFSPLKNAPQTHHPHHTNRHKLTIKNHAKVTRFSKTPQKTPIKRKKSPATSRGFFLQIFAS
jgi:hypothetical protein